MTHSFPAALAALALLAPPAVAQERAPVEPNSLPAPDQPMEPAEPSVERLEDGRYRVGQVTFDPRKREIRFPARINMVDGLLEFAIVHENGKIHESLLHTDISAIDLNVAFKLLRYQASPELYVLPNETGGLTNDFPEVQEELRRAARIRISVEWNDDGRERLTPINDWILHAVRGEAMPQGPWVYGGSFMYDGRFVPETTGDLVAIFITNSSLINYPGEDNQDDTVWLVHPRRVPPEGTRVTVVISPDEPQPDPETP